MRSHLLARNLCLPSPLPQQTRAIPRRIPRSTSHNLLLFSVSPRNPILRRTHVTKSSQIDDGAYVKEADLELLGKPSPIPFVADEEASSPTVPPEREETLAPLFNFFKATGSSTDLDSDEKREAESMKVAVEYYDPKPGDLVVGVIVSGNEKKLDVSIGADMLGTMLTKEVLPLYKDELPYLLCDVEENAEEFLVRGKVGVVKDEEALSRKRVPGRPVVDVGTVIFAEVLGRTLSGRPLLSMRRMFRRVAWQRVRQIMQLNEPIEVKISEWNTGGLLTRIEGLRAFLPKAELMNRVNNFTDLKNNVGRRIHVRICRMDEVTNDLIISEREAWEMMYLKEGTLLQGTVRKIFPYGAQIRIGETSRSGLLHVSNISRARVTSVSDILKVDEEVKVLVVKSMYPDKISLSIADIESEPGLFLSNRERVFSEAEEMAKRYRQRLPVISATNKPEPLLNDTLPFDDESTVYSNWKWFKFEQHDEVDNSGDSQL
ncbi:protein PIGMENT DEFECTIVE 338, chloroplastic-like [Typha angustifolia]|uniref:protein PIGMENT DEFECTIVE 338, chloroplastic-like n=1 Tax=Typha angustifolia TaxID=59011 RepID=UPI003C2F8B64